MVGGIAETSVVANHFILSKSKPPLPNDNTPLSDALFGFGQLPVTEDSTRGCFTPSSGCGMMSSVVTPPEICLGKHRTATS